MLLPHQNARKMSQEFGPDIQIHNQYSIISTNRGGSTLCIESKRLATNTYFIHHKDTQSFTHFKCAFSILQNFPCITSAAPNHLFAFVTAGGKINSSSY
jgi:hypothetical protein